MNRSLIAIANLFLVASILGACDTSAPSSTGDNSLPDAGAEGARVESDASTGADADPEAAPAARCDTCSKRMLNDDSTNIQDPLCRENGPPSSRELFLALVACTCTAKMVECNADCATYCSDKLAYDDACRTCVRSECKTEFDTCLADK